MMAMVVAMAFWSRSNNLRIASLVVLTNWLLFNFLTTNMGTASVNIFAPLNIVFFCFLYFLYRDDRFQGKTFYRPLLFFYSLYILIDFWHFSARLFFPEAFSASYYYMMLLSNIVFIMICMTFVVFSILKGIGNRTEGGLMVVFEDWSSRISNFSREYKEMSRDEGHEESDVLGPIVFCFKKHILKKVDVKDSEEASEADKFSDKVE